MPLGTTPLTLFHVALSLVGIAAGFVVMAGMLQARGCRAGPRSF